ncbi:MAG TPA: heme lyase CcmF/NrfE family subunit [Pseudomonadales bacterium]|nr:heme lyase CcmF/NrfE family subunit [Pseudomonadales bacterium]
MIPEFGLYSLILAFCLALALGTLPMAGSYLHEPRWMRLSSPLALLMCALVCFSFGTLVYSFIVDDFSVTYVANNSNSQLPVYYKVSATWGAHEGSLLLWVLILTLWMSAFTLTSKKLPLVLRTRILSVLGMVGAGFTAFTLFTSNPFARELPFTPEEGADLNPLLQDFGLIVHPPILYCGYVGFAVPFAFAIAALLQGGIDNHWTRWIRPWANTAWAFLTIGIALGSWWAYYELGWGGWWFWDPVENASFMPWLAGTALLHALAATDKRKLFSNWTLLLAIFAFSLSLLGTFLVRSGVLTSVHAFASDPTRGYFILVFLAVVVGGSLTLFALRAPEQASSHYSFLSRDTAILISSSLVVIILAVVCLGTLYPLIADALGWGKISVGPPYFNRFFMPLMGAVLLLLPFGVTMNWHGKHTAKELLLWCSKPVFVSLVVAPLLLLALALPVSFSGILGAWFGLWVIVSTLFDIRHKIRNARSPAAGLGHLRASYWGMCLAHIGLAISALGIVLTSVGSEQRELRLAPGEQTSLAGYVFHFQDMQQENGPNYITQTGLFYVTGNNGSMHILHPEKRRYLATNRMMTEAGIAAGFSRDIYVSLGEALAPEQGNASAWSVRLHVKPAVRWIWLGAILIAAGGILSVLDKRYRKISDD